MNILSTFRHFIQKRTKSINTSEAFIPSDYIESLPSDDGGRTHEIIAHGGTFNGRRARIMNISISGAYFNFK